jgi:glutaminyl-tRNA synthetase
MYDYAHGVSDALEGITHSICTLEFEDHRPLYDWFLRQTPVPFFPQQIEFARLNLTYMVMSKRKLLQLVTSGVVTGWDDPRMPTIAGMRRRGYTPEALRTFAEKIGVAKMSSTIDIELLQFCVREHLNQIAQRVMVVLRPIKLVIDNYPDDQVEWLEADNNPEDHTAGKRMIPFSKELYIEADDFMETPPPKYFRLSLGKEVRLKHAYYVTATSLAKDALGVITEVHGTYDPESRGGWSQDGRKVMGTSHWVSIPHAVDAAVRLYDHLFTKPNPEEVEEGQDFMENLNQNSVQNLTGCKAEPSLSDIIPGTRYQFLRQGYFCVDMDSQKDQLIFNQTVSLKDSWSKGK